MHHRPTAALANHYCLERELGAGQICSRNSGDHPDLDVTEPRWDTPLPRVSELTPSSFVSRSTRLGARSS